MKLKHVVLYENILDEFIVCIVGSRSRLLKHLQNLINQFAKSIADGSSLQRVQKVFIAKDSNNISYTVRYGLEGKVQFVRNLPCMQTAVIPYAAYTLTSLIST